MTARREQIAALAALVAVTEEAQRAAGRVSAGGPVRLPLEAAEAVDRFLAAAAEVARVAEVEIVALESARDVIGGAP